MALKVVLAIGLVSDNWNADLILKPFAEERNGYLPNYLRSIFTDIIASGITVKFKENPAKSNVVAPVNNMKYYNPQFIINNMIYHTIESQLSLLATLLAGEENDYIVGIEASRYLPVKLIANLKGFVAELGGTVVADAGAKFGRVPFDEIKPYYDSLSYKQWLSQKENKHDEKDYKANEDVFHSKKVSKANRKVENTVNEEPTLEATVAVKPAKKRTAKVVEETANQEVASETSIEVEVKKPSKKRTTKVATEEMNAMADLSMVEETPAPKRRRTAKS